MTERYRIAYEGRLHAGVRAEDAAARLVEIFGMDRAQAEQLIDSDRPRVLKRDLDAQKGERYRAALSKAGLLVRLEPMEPGPAGPDQGQAGATVVAPRRPPVIPPREPALQPGPAAEGPEPAWRPDHAAYASGSPPFAEDAGPGGPGAPESLPAGRGAGWIGAGFGYFSRSMGGWLLAILLFFIISVLVGLVPLVGNLATAILWPIFTAGFMLGARDQDRGEPFRVEHLFKGFQTNVGQLALVGLIYTALGILLTILVLAVMFTLVGSASLGSAAMLGDLGSADPAAASFGIGMLLTTLILALLVIPLTMLILFAPALVALDGLPAWDAMKTSFRGCLRNIIPFLIYGLLALPLLVVAAIPFGLGLLVVGPALTAAIYVAWREIYHAGVAPGA
jgi:uncharacterized membrane protein